MKKSLFAASLAATCAVAGAACAADLPRGPAPYYSSPAPVGIFNWAGPYAGLNIGYQWANVTNSVLNPAGIAGGGQIGYNWQNAQFVFGVETDIQFSGADDTFAPWQFSNPWFGTLRGRAGYAFNNIMVYATLGLAYGELKGDFLGLSETKFESGWAAGLGAEYGINANWSAKVEYLYSDLGDRAFSITGASNGLQSSYLRFGLNYHF